MYIYIYIDFIVLLDTQFSAKPGAYVERQATSIQHDDAQSGQMEARRPCDQTAVDLLKVDGTYTGKSWVY